MSESPIKSSGFDDYASALEWARKQDDQDPLKPYREKFHIPSRNDLKARTLARPDGERDTSPQSTYLCGNSLGLQPKSTADHIQAFLTQWRTKGVLGHFVGHTDSPLESFLHTDDHAARLMAPIVGARESEVAIMGTLTGNLHLMMASFYLPNRKAEGRYKVMLEGKAFPSDHYAIESQIIHAGLVPEDTMVLLEPSDASHPTLTTEQILEAIDKHADELALVLLPGIQYYTGQWFDMKSITAHAHSKGILIGWDCAHAVGNVVLDLHNWDVDFAVWCTYKYLNCGPGAMGGVFVHEKHGQVVKENETIVYRPRLSGWWGNDKSTRFQMTSQFRPRPGAAGFQLSNPSALDLASVVASLKLFNEATMPRLRRQSLLLTDFLEKLLLDPKLVGQQPPYEIITPSEHAARGAQLSIKLKSGKILDKLLESLEDDAVVIDERKPDVIRVAPAPMYNSYSDVVKFCQAFSKAIIAAQSGGA